MSKKKNEETMEYLRSITAYDFLTSTPVDGQIFTTKVVMSFLKVHFAEEALKDGWITPEQSKAITKTDKALEKLFKAFRDRYVDNIIDQITPND
jgi:hypothetical protein